MKQTRINPATRTQIEQAVKAHQALTSLTCRIVSLAHGIPRPSGTVTLAFRRPGYLRLEARSKRTGLQTELMVCDSNYFYRAQFKRKVFSKARVPAGGDAVRAAFLTANPLPLPIFSWLLIETNPLEKLLSPEIVAVEAQGEKVINGVLCRVFLFRSTPGRGDSTLAFGKADGIVRQVSVLVKRPDGTRIDIVEDYLEVKVNPTLPAPLWDFSVPAGFRDAAAPRPPLPPPASLGPDAITTASGLQYRDLKAGSGAEVKTGSKVEVHYVGTLTDGEEFDSSYDRGQPFSFTVPGDVIAGWNEGLIGMRVGGKRKLVVPPSLGYGPQANGPVPPNATLLFEIDLLAVK